MLSEEMRIVNRRKIIKNTCAFVYSREAGQPSACHFAVRDAPAGMRRHSPSPPSAAAAAKDTDGKPAAVCDTVLCALEPAKYYSSDSNRSLVYAGSDGSVAIHRITAQSILTEPTKLLPPAEHRRDTRFYPADDAVLTTTDDTGLVVWDVARATPVFAYRRDSLTRHAYGPDCLLGTTDGSCLKFFDLRCRYQVAEMVCRRVEALGWADHCICTLRDGEAAGWDARALRSEMRPLWMRRNAIALETTGDCAFTLEMVPAAGLVKPVRRLVRVLSNGDAIGKASRYSGLARVTGRFGVAGVEDGVVYLESLDGKAHVALPGAAKEVQAVHWAEDSGVLVCADDALYSSFVFL